MRILLIDDTRFNLVVLEKMVKSMGHEVVVADSAKKAFTILQNRSVDVVLTDQDMPETTGLEFAKQCKEALEILAEKKLPIFFMITAFKDETLERSAFRIGFSGVIEKPLKEPVLQNLLERCEAGEFARKPVQRHILVLGTGECFKEMIVSSIQSQHVDIDYVETVQEGLDYCNAHPTVTHIFCADFFDDGLSMLDFSKQLIQQRSSTSSELKEMPDLMMVLSTRHSNEGEEEKQKALVEAAMKQGIKEILKLPISSSRLCQILGEASSEEEEESRSSILIIDDLSFNCSLLERTLKPYGHCLKASSGKEALSLFHTKSGIEMVVCDLFMPEMTGLEFYHYVQQNKHVDSNGQARKIPFVFVTACNNEELIEKTKLLVDENKEDVYFFHKPAHKEELVRIAKKALGLEEENSASPYAHLFT